MEFKRTVLLLLCHHADWEHRYQASAAAAAAATGGREVRVVLFFGALDAWLSGAWDRAPEPGRAYGGVELAERAQELELGEPSQMLATARRSGRCQILACSASLALVGRRAVDLAELVDEVVGWPTILQMMQPGTQVLYL